MALNSGFRRSAPKAGTGDSRQDVTYVASAPAGIRGAWQDLDAERGRSCGKTAQQRHGHSRRQQYMPAPVSITPTLMPAPVMPSKLTVRAPVASPAQINGPLCIQCTTSRRANAKQRGPDQLQGRSWSGNVCGNTRRQKEYSTTGAAFLRIEWDLG